MTELLKKNKNIVDLILGRYDRRWVAHRLLDGQANLRVSPKWGKMPVVAYVF